MAPVFKDAVSTFSEIRYGGEAKVTNRKQYLKGGLNVGNMP